MPRAADYRHAARVLRARGTALTETAATYRRRHIGEFGRGPIADAHDAAMGTIASRLAAAGGELLALAELCERRADVGAALSDDLWRWYIANTKVRAHPPAARPLPSWIAS